MKTDELLIKYPGKTKKRPDRLIKYLYAGFHNYHSNTMRSLIRNGKAGTLIDARYNLLLQIKNALQDALDIGGAPATTESSLGLLHKFFVFLERENLAWSREKLERNYLLYCEKVLCRRLARKEITGSTAYTIAATLGNVFDSVLGNKKYYELVSKTRLRNVGPRKNSLKFATDKQNLSDTFTMGSFVVQVIIALKPESIRSNPLIRSEISLPNGRSFELKLALGPVANRKYENLEASSEELTESQRYHRAKRIADGWDPKGDEISRIMLLELRVACELMVFLAQTGMNISEALKIENHQFKYASLGDEWVIKSYKSRRQGEIEFKIYKNYKAKFKTYLKFLSEFYPGRTELFPNDSSEFRWFHLKKLVLDNAIPWVPANTIRKTRENWFLRRSGDPDLTAEAHQHLRETLHSNYERPSQQRAISEITRFHGNHDPLQKDQFTTSNLLSECDGVPSPVPDLPDSVVAPNCLNPSGCLWCSKRLDWKSFDYVWNLASFRHLKLIEASGQTASVNENPSDLIVARV